MLPCNLPAADPGSEPARYKTVRRYKTQGVPGLALSANVETRICLLRPTNGTAREFTFGIDGLRIVSAAR